MRTLPASLKSRFYIDGHFSPIKVFSPEETAQVYQDYRQYIARLGTEGRLEGDGRFRVHLLAGWAARIVSHPVLVSAVKTVLETENVLVWSSDLCIKPPVSRGEFCWHQDSTYSGLQPSNRVVTAWLALTPSNLNSGSLSVISDSQAESGTAGVRDHQDTHCDSWPGGQVVRHRKYPGWVGSCNKDYRHSSMQSKRRFLFFAVSPEIKEAHAGKNLINGNRCLSCLSPDL